ncbi:hypothetical protein [Winogradskyella marincola]|uniref:Riboflavin synthase subunit beta n=1 Tax=Winogradskyella marincola TaxID=3037795 RepID=A0ABT6G0C1_9FLAO|nr:hypothetical protein [Winogradskyella sp. YYF002]MDG4715495.1 hypothetical protein [Winogradskyella sp. YYF002]
MGLGAGHVLDMINRMKQNRAQRPSNRDKFKQNNREGIYSSEVKKKPKFKTVSEEELLKIKEQIKANVQKQRKKEIKIFSIVFILIILIVFGFIKFLL